MRKPASGVLFREKIANKEVRKIQDSLMPYMVRVNFSSAVSRRRLLALGAASCCALYIVTVIPKYNAYTDQWQENRDTYKRIETILDTIPEDVPICVPSSYVAHVADRREVYELNYHATGTDAVRDSNVEYVVIRRRNDSKHRNTFESCGYTVWAEYEDIVILQRPQE
jgi:hypothetical protein